MKEFTPQDWIAAGYTRFEASDMRPGEDFFVQKRIRDENGDVLYHITVSVTDVSKIPGVQLPHRWGFTPRVDFRCEPTVEVAVHTSDPEVAEAKFHDLWVFLGKPCE